MVSVERLSFDRFHFQLRIAIGAEILAWYRSLVVNRAQPMFTPAMKRGALPDIALGDEWAFDRGSLVSDMVNRTASDANVIPQHDMTSMYAKTEKVDRQNSTIRALAAQVSELTRAQKSANGTANVLVGKIGAMADSIDRPSQKLGSESQRQAEKTRRRDESLNYVHQAQQQWWGQQEHLQDSHQRRRAEIWGHR